MPHDRPILLKCAPSFTEMDYSDFKELPLDGFTWADSEKYGAYTCINDIPVWTSEKGSICGEQLQEGTLQKIYWMRQHLPNTHLSASGGIMDEKSAIQAFEKSANSIQLCSAIMFGGFNRVKKIVRATHNYAA